MADISEGVLPVEAVEPLACDDDAVERADPDSEQGCRSLRVSFYLPLFLNFCIIYCDLMQKIVW